MSNRNEMLESVMAGVFSVGILTIIFQKSRCFLRKRTDGDGGRLPAEWGVGFTEAILVPRSPPTKAAFASMLQANLAEKKHEVGRIPA